MALYTQKPTRRDPPKSTPIEPGSTASTQPIPLPLSPFNLQLKHDADICSILKQMGYTNRMKITNSLQGSIWRSMHAESAKTVVIKVVRKSLHDQSLGIIDGKQYPVHENICIEQSILKYISQKTNCPISIIKWNRFFKTDTHYGLVMEDGGMSLFDFVQTAHVLLYNCQLSLPDWKKAVKVIFKQMIECIGFLHKHNICHNDISLENFLINDLQIACDEHSKVSFVGDIQIKLCDFGLVTLFPSNECLSNRYCGKTQYKSPEVINEMTWFDAKRNGIWCLGICLLMMSIGFGAWTEAHESDEAFMYVMNNGLDNLLKIWNVHKYVDANLVNLFGRIFQYEDQRINLHDIKAHPFVTSS